MSRILVSVALALAVLLGGGASRASTPLRHVALGAGIDVRLPEGWRVFRHHLTSCSSPTERLFVATVPAGRLGLHNAVPDTEVVILLLEDGINAPSSFPRRPERFRLPARRMQFEGCCDMPTTPGYELRFRDGGRDFEALVYPGAHAPRRLLDQAARILNGLRVTPARAS
jgi:hypothetical protein